MAQKRMLDKKISLSEKVADLDLLGKLLYTWMIPHADDLGLLQGSARTIKGLVLPLENATVEDIGFQLETMLKVGLISQVIHNQKKYYHIVDFEKNQTLKQDRQPQTILDFDFDKDPKQSWKKINSVILELNGNHLEDNGNHLESEVKLREDKISNRYNGIFKRLPKINVANEKIEFITGELSEKLHDTHSKEFYRQVAAYVPESKIREALAEIKIDGAKDPAKVFTYKMKKYALSKSL